MIKEEDYIKFLASISPAQNAIQISGIRDGAKIKLEVPQSEMKSILDLYQLAGQVFEVIIIPLNKKVVDKINKIKFLKDQNEST